MDTLKQTPEYKAYKYLQHWYKQDDQARLKELILQDKKPLFRYMFEKTEQLYSRLPRRKDGQERFVHPLNVVLALQIAGIKDEAALCVGLIHDYVEEMVDLYKEEKKIVMDKDGLKKLDGHESRIFKELEEDLSKYSDEKKTDLIISALKLLTRHKRDFYYKSISGIFQYDNEKVKDIAIQVKLADRIHNILSINSFNEQERIYQCFKNLFILNNAKKYLLEKPEERISTTQDIPSTQLLFKRCSKATYDAFLTICHLCLSKGLHSINSMIQLAFKKFALEKAGVWEVTKVDPHETHLMRLFHGVVRKYDARLHHEWEKFEQMKEAEYDYCRKFFADYDFSEEQVRAIIDYKDAYSLKEVVASLLYLPDYFIHRFLSSELTKDARIIN